jgi:hypothetical protein
MQKGFGIAALVIAIIAIFIPLFGPWVTIISALLAALAYGSGFAFGISSIVINLINIFILSPTVWVFAGMTSAMEASSGKSFLSLGTFLFVVQIVAGVVLFLLNSKKKVSA